MEFGPLAILALVWWVFSLVTQGKKKGQDRRPPRPGPPAPRGEPEERLPAARGDATQQEGGRLEALMREFERAMEEASGVRRPAPGPVETPAEWDTGLESPAEELEEIEALDAYQPEVVSQEDEANFYRPEREVVVLGGDPEELRRQRVQYAEVRTQALTKADHTRFDTRIRETSKVAIVDPGAPASERIKRLRQAIIWREVLGPPVSMRGGDRQ